MGIIMWEWEQGGNLLMNQPFKTCFSSKYTTSCTINLEISIKILESFHRCKNVQKIEI